MRRILLRRLAGLLPQLLGLALLSFLLLQFAPGDVLSELRLNPEVSDETISRLRTRYGLDLPWHAQLGRWLMGLARGDFGYSFLYQRPAAELVRERAVNTVLLAACALGLTALLSIPGGILAARYRWVARAGAFLATISLSLPSLLLAVLAMLFAAATGWFPIGGVSSLDAANMSAAQRAGDYLHHAALPAAVLTLRQSPVWFRQLQAQLQEALAEEFILTARAKGLSESRILLRHALRNAVAPLITTIGSSLGALLSGAFVVEAVMSWPGIGSLAVSSLLSRDLYVLMACLLHAALLLAAGNLLADLLLFYADPRLRRDGRGGA